MSQSQPYLSQSQPVHVGEAPLSDKKDMAFNPGASVISSDAIHRWLYSPINGDLIQVPGIGQKTKDCLVNLNVHSGGKESNIENTYQLIAKFLSLRTLGSSNIDHFNTFWFWLKEQNINAEMNSIVRAIAEKCTDL